MLKRQIPVQITSAVPSHRLFYYKWILIVSQQVKQVARHVLQHTRYELTNSSNRGYSRINDHKRKAARQRIIMRPSDLTP